MQQEERLVERAKQGEPEAFEQLYEAYFDKMYRYVAFRVSNQADAEDLTQQVFLKALESIGSFRWRGAPFSSWLFRIAHNQVVDHYRKRDKENTLPLDEESLPSTADPAVLTEQRLTMEELAVACKQLTGAQQEVISLRFAGGLSVAETAQIMGRSEGATRVLQHNALAKLRRVFSAGDGEMNG